MAPARPGRRVEVAARPPFASMLPAPDSDPVLTHTEPPAPDRQRLAPLARTTPSTCTRSATIRTVPPPLLPASKYPPAPFSCGVYTLPYVSPTGGFCTPPSPRWLPPESEPCSVAPEYVTCTGYPRPLTSITPPDSTTNSPTSSRKLSGATFDVVTCCVSVAPALTTSRDA